MARPRSSSLSLSPVQRHWDTHHMRTPPISRGPRVASPAYKHLEEVEPAEMEAESLRGYVRVGIRKPVSIWCICIYYGSPLAAVKAAPLLGVQQI